MVTRNKSIPSTQTQTAAAAEDVVTPTIDLNDEQSMLDMLRSIGASMGVEIPTGKRMLASFGVGVLVSVGGGVLAGQLAGYVFIGALLFTSSMFLAYLAMLIVFIVGIYLATIAASRASAYVATGQLEKDVVRVKNYFTGFFTPATKLGATS